MGSFHSCFSKRHFLDSGHHARRHPNHREKPHGGEPRQQPWLSSRLTASTEGRSHTSGHPGHSGPIVPRDRSPSEGHTEQENHTELTPTGM